MPGQKTGRAAATMIHPDSPGPEDGAGAVRMDHRRARGRLQHSLGDRIEQDEAAGADHRQQNIAQGRAGRAEQAGGHDDQAEGEGGGDGQQQIGFETLQDFTFT